MSLAVLISSLVVLMTCAVLRFRSAKWLRRTTIVYLGMALLFFGVFGLTNVARFGISDIDVKSMQPAEYSVAFRDGLIAAQNVVYRYLPTVSILWLCLGVLAWFPARMRQE